ncbi:MAG: hypothetical protein KA712_08005 [Myxococcales bacterium]|nr:hypothetical protein [Myxococcales bacterium]
MSEPPPPVRRRPHFGLWLVLLTFAWGAGTLLLFSDGAVSLYVDMVALYVGAVVVGMAALVTLIAGSVSRAGNPPGAPRRWLPLATTCLVMAIVPSLCRYAVPFSVRFSLSEQSLLAAVQHASSLQVKPGWIGWFDVRQVEFEDGTTLLATGVCAVKARCGIAYKADGRPSPTERTAYKAFRGPWWLFEQRSP